MRRCVIGLLPSITNFLVDCNWSLWEEWTMCSKSCGAGSKTSKRKIIQEATHGGNNCIGDSERKEQCNLGPCPGNKEIIWK